MIQFWNSSDKNVIQFGASNRPKSHAFSIHA
jgi:hypothetical protein